MNIKYMPRHNRSVLTSVNIIMRVIKYVYIYLYHKSSGIYMDIIYIPMLLQLDEHIKLSDLV